MKKRLVLAMTAAIMAVGIASCGKTPSTVTDPNETGANTSAENVSMETPTESQGADDDTANDTKDNQVAEAGSESSVEETTEIAYPTFPLPEYHYYGPEDWADYGDSISQFLIENTFGESEADLQICVPTVVKVDDSNPGDVKVWGEYMVYAYQLVNTTLQGTSGGSYGGVAHIDATGESLLVTGIDFLEDGSDFDPSFKKLFDTKELQDAYLEACDNRDQYQAQALSYYINQNGLYITQYQQYGWPPVSIPNAPPTREEDQIIYHVGNFEYTTQYDMRKVCSLELEDSDVFAGVICDDWSDFLISIYFEEDMNIENAISNLRSNLFDETVELTRQDDVTFLGKSGCTLLMSEGPYKDGDMVYVNYLVPKNDRYFVVKISSTYSEDEAKQMATDGIIEAFLGNMELKN